MNHLCSKLSHLHSNILQVLGVLLSGLGERGLQLVVLMLPLFQLCALGEEFSLQGINVSRHAGLVSLHAQQLLLQEQVEMEQTPELEYHTPYNAQAEDVYIKYT